MIKNIIDECVSDFKANTLFRKMVIMFSAIGGALFLLFGIFTVIGLSRTSVAQINAAEQQLLGQARNTSDSVLRDVHSFSDNCFSNDAAIRAAMTQPYSPEISVNLQSSFEDIMAISSLIESIYVANFADNVIYSTDTSARSADNFIDADIIDYLENNPPRTDIFFSRAAKIDIDPINTRDADYLTSVYRNSPDFALVINLNQEAFQSLINMSSDRDSYQTAILDSDGYVISHTNPEYFAQNMTDDPLFSRVLNSGEDSGTFRYDGASVNFVRSNTLGYSYISISSGGSALAGFKSFLIYMAVFMILLLLLYLIGSVVISLHAYSVFNSLKKGLYSLFNKNIAEEDNDEVGNISKLIDDAKSKYHSMETMQYQYANSKRNITLKNLLTGTFSYLPEDMDSCGITFSHQGFAVVVMRVDGLSKMGGDTLYMVKYAIMNMGSELFENSAAAYTCEIDEYNIAFILNFINGDFIEETVNKLNLYLKKFFNATASAGYDMTVTDSLEDISTLYHSAKNALSYKIVSGAAAVIKAADAAYRNGVISTYPENLEQSIIKSITAQNDGELERNVHTFIDSLKKISYNAIVLYIDRLIVAIEQLSARSKMSDDTDMPTNIQSVIAELETLDKIEAYIMSRCRSLMLKFSSIKHDSSREIMVRSLIEYIDDNYTDSNLSIDMIASSINRSSNYTRSMFKQSQGISISDYIAKKRFDEACRMLVETNLSAQEIGTSLGFSSGSYFYTAFKKYTGHTPEQYRKSRRQSK